MSKLAKSKVIDECLYCGDIKELQRSHTINKTYFKRLLKSCGDTNAAKEVSLSSNYVKNSNDNWTDFLLCKECESYFNQHFDAYGAKALRGQISSIKIYKTNTFHFYQNIDTTKIILYMLSLYWRGAKSKHTAYDHLITNDNFHYNLKLCFQERKWNYDHINIKISIIYDSFNALDNEGVKQLLTSPFKRIHKKLNAFSFLFIFEGFLIELFFGKLSFSSEKKGNWLKKNSNFIKCQKIDLYDIDEIQVLIGHMFKVKETTRG